MISLKEYIINESFDDMLKLSEIDKKKLIELDKKFGELIVKFDECQPFTKLLNFNEEINKYINSYNTKNRYYPNFKHNTSKYDKKTQQEFKDEVKFLITEFESFNQCYLSKFYIERLNGVNDCLENKNNNKDIYYLDDPIYIKALDIVKKHPYEKINEDKRNISADDVIKELNKKIKEFKYDGWECKKNDHNIIRVTVSLFDHCIYVSDNFKYSKEDIEGLIQHEAYTHVGRKYYGEKIGLELFKCGFRGRSSLDEGLAIWRSLNKVKKQKQNILFNCAMRYIICSQLQYSTFDGLVDLLQKMAPEMKFEKVVNVIGRCLREFEKIDNDNLHNGYYGDDRTYLRGYLFVDKLSDAERDDVLKYNIGIKHFDSLPTIKKFLKINKFE